MKTSLSHILIGSLLFTGVVTTSLISQDDTGSLGPTDTLTLSGKEGDLVIKNSDKHISWGDEKTSTAWSIGFMETGKALSQLMQADHFKEDRQDLDAELREGMTETRLALDAVSQEAQNIEPDDPNAGKIRQQWQQLYDEFQHLQKLGADARGALMAKQMQESYDEIVESVNVVSERMNIDMVLRFIPPDSEFIQDKPDATIMQIRLRTALRLPEGIDITDEVLAELGLDG
jgi:Skp family chaperone for outer membrane proteins